MSTFWNQVRFMCPTAGAGSPLDVGPAVIASQTPVQAGIPDGTAISYSILDGANFEEGVGITGNSGTTFTRACLTSNNDNDPIVLSGNAQVAFTVISSDLAPLSFMSVSGDALSFSGMVLFGVIPREVTANTSFTAGATDQILGLNPTISASFTVTLPLSSSRNGVPIGIVDLKGFAQAFPVSVAMTGSDKCLGVSTGAPLANILNQNYQSLFFKPRASGGYFL